MAMDELDKIEDFREIESEILSFAQHRGIDLESFRHSSGFFHDGRDVSYWRRRGVLHYCIQGDVAVLPDEFKESASEFHGIYQESGTMDSFDQAIQLLEAWLIRRSDVDQLPKRLSRKRGIG
jgi:hypothetical protein